MSTRARNAQRHPTPVCEMPTCGERPFPPLRVCRGHAAFIAISAARDHVTADTPDPHLDALAAVEAQLAGNDLLTEGIIRSSDDLVQLARVFAVIMAQLVAATGDPAALLAALRTAAILNDPKETTP